MNEQAKCDFLRKRMIELREKNGKSQAEMAELITQVAFYGGWPKAWAAFNYAKEIYADEK